MALWDCSTSRGSRALSLFRWGAHCYKRASTRQKWLVRAETYPRKHWTPDATLFRFDTRSTGQPRNWSERGRKPCRVLPKPASGLCATQSVDRQPRYQWLIGPQNVRVHSRAPPALATRALPRRLGNSPSIADKTQLTRRFYSSAKAAPTGCQERVPKHNLLVV
jgi:hypothetical protein